MSFEPSNTTDELPIAPEKAFDGWRIGPKDELMKGFEDMMNFTLPTYSPNNHRIIYWESNMSYDNDIHNWGTNER